ncbi:MAG: thiamine pyrophosphate-binding protein [Desulfotomaculaceae bacterium]|nr:thiamine pyrophosphate-binding protein [Desulfotomaculaceae bacterium]
MAQTIGELILKALAGWGVKNIYGVLGDAILPLMDDLGKQQQIRFYSTATEEGAAFMACGEARVTGRLGVCLATEGPGATNLLNGVADAYRDNIPMLVITGQVESAKIATNAKQYINQQQLFAPVTSFTTLLTRPESALGVLQIAVEKALGDSTPCHISVPKDILMSPAHNTVVPSLGQPYPPSIMGNLEKAAKALGASQKPLLLAGRAALPFRDQVLQLANMIGAGIIPAQGARGIYPGFEVRLLAGLGEAHIPPLIKKTDCLLLVGDCPYEHKYLPTDVKVIQIDSRPRNLASHLRPAALTGDMGQIINSLTEKLAGFVPDPHWQGEIQRSHDEHVRMITDEILLQQSPIAPRQVIALLNEALPEDSIITIDVGEFMHWFDRGFMARQQQVIISDYWRCMGCGLPYGLGAQVAFPGKKIVVLTGNGDFIMTMQELLTASRYGLPVVVVIFNNGIYSLEKHKMQKAGLNPFGIDVAVPDFVKLAEACGATGIRVEKPEELAKVLKKAMLLDQPVVIDIQVSQDKPAFI